MTRIDFYQITDSQLSENNLVFKLCQKAYQGKQKVLLLSENESHSNLLDRLLWTSEDDSFIPHDQQEQTEIQTPILVTHEADPQGDREILINLSSQIPLYFAQFERIIELVTNNNKESARNHFSYYKDRGYELNHHKL